MVRTGGPRGHGSGRAKTPEAEAARREKIRKAALERKKQVRVLIVSDYRLKGRPETGNRRRIPDWTYLVGRQYSTRIDPKIASNPAKLQAHLNRLHPNREHYRTRVLEFLT